MIFFDKEWFKKKSKEGKRYNDKNEQYEEITMLLVKGSGV